MKLLFIHDHPFFVEKENIYSGGGLPSTVWNNYLDSFDSVKVIARKTENLNNKVSLSSGDPRVTFKLTSHYTSVLSFLLNRKKIESFLSKEMEDVDMVLLRLPSILGFMGYTVAKKLNKPFFVEQVGNCKEAFLYKSFLGKLIAPTLDYINQRIVLNVPFVIYVTKKNLQTIYKSNGKTIDIPNVCLFKVIQPQSINLNRFTGEIMKIGLIGTFDTIYKGQETLLKAIHILPNEIKKNIHVYLVGKGDYKWVEKHITQLDLRKNIQFLGSKQNGQEIFDFLNEISLYVQPSYTEGMPRAVLEAMSMGCPVLGSMAGGIPDILEESQLHKPKDYRTLSEQIKLRYLNRNLLITESRNNIEIIMSYQIDSLKEKRTNFFTLIKQSTEKNIV